MDFDGPHGAAQPEPIAQQVDAMLTDLEDRVQRSLERLEFTDEVIQLCILRITKELILKSMRSREHQQQLQYNPHYGYQQPRIAQDGPRNGGAAGYGVAAGVGAGYAHVLNPSGTTSLTSAQRRVPEEAPQHNGEGRQPNSRTTSGSGSEGSDGDGTSGGSPPGDERSPAGQGSDEPQEILTAM